MWSGYSLCLLLAAIAAVSSQEDTNSGSTTNLYGGDIVLTPEQQATLEATANPNDPFSPQDAVVRNQRSLWPNGEVFYVIDNSINAQGVNAIQAAMATYQRLTCIRFTQRTTQNDYVRFFSGGGCFSFIGRVGGPQDISIGRGCEFEGVVIHEIFHALGRWHEQSRPDRDQFVRINTENIQSGRENNFDITSTSFVTTQGIPYDLGSIMHYSARAFSRNGQPTITPVDSSVQLSELGQRQGLSDRDRQHVLTLYCDGGSPGSWSSWSSWSSCSRTCNGGSQSRTRTCQGGTNCEGSNVQNRQCNTQSCPTPATWSSWSTWSGCSASCGGGRQQRTRRCVGGNTCVGAMNQFRNCGTADCPEPATWGSWGSWSSCSSTCQGGLRQRRRTCQNGNNCPGNDLEDENCNTNIPCTTPTNPNSGEWTSWSSCSAQCGGGVRFRTRQCGVPISNCATQEESCNTDDCDPEPFLNGIRYRGCWYLNTRTGRLGTLEGRSPDLSDDPFTRTEPVSKCGLQAQRDNFRYFGVTLGYCISGSNLLSDYQYYPSQLCRDGRGAYNRGYFIMDVYEITNQQSFSDSAVAGISQVTEGTTDDFNGSPGLTHSLVTLLVSMLIGLFCIFH